jgi:alkylation response protein AidB-like acyl-CoA dehydrogenase
MGEHTFTERAAALGPELRDRSEEIDALRRLPDDLVEGLIDEGFLRFWVPAQYGGAEISLLEGLETFIELARHDTAVAWCCFIANTTAITAGLLPPRWAEELFGPPGAVAGGFAAPVGRARAVEGGLRVTGRWQWGSGTQHCSVIGGGVLLVDDDGAVAPREDGLLAPFVLLDRDDVTFHDTWHVLGVRGSGSTDYEVTDAFVPEGRWVELTRPTPQVDGALYRFSLFSLLAGGIGCTAIGVAERALEEFVTLARGKVPQGSGRTLSERPSAQADVAKAEATIASARLFLLDAYADAWATAEAGGEPSVEQRRLVRLATTDATQRCADVVSRLHRAAGGEAVYQRCPLERLFRDANVVSQHAMAAERTYELAGRLTFGLDSDTSTL